MGVIIFCLCVYGIIQLLKFFLGATISDLKSHVTGNWYSDEKEKENDRNLIRFGKFVLAFVAAGWLLSYF